MSLQEGEGGETQGCARSTTAKSLQRQVAELQVFRKKKNEKKSKKGNISSTSVAILLDVHMAKISDK